MKTLMPLLTGAVLAGSLATAQANEIVVGGKNFTEQQILSSMTTQYLEGLGYDVEKRAGLGSAVLRQAQENGQIDLYWEYTGTSLINYNDESAEGLTVDETYQKVKELDAEKGLVWLEPSDANNTYALAMRKESVEETGITTLSDLAQAVNDEQGLTFAMNAEFYAREDGWRPLQQAYEFRAGRGDVKRMDSGLVYQALRDEQVDVGLVFATDGRIPAFDFQVLEDDQNFFPAYALTPVVRQATLDANPELAEQMNTLSGLLDNDTMSTLNARVDVDKTSIERVAENFLEENDLL
ncbi:glycine betaine ABC transporter substrate-binding protein [Chromohalobacter israelensis]|uniref:Substrate-binding region of ABC-type glycine betaine transport system n=1 Tax=Chromohalobacter israelensis (strain ATCC BAA-138 / DSM 3043 / CIP 106854 / NCIMB 13768 / 1H11) TaxID=290398 RepID=Q1QV03_CHRI1|nr:glycine betaine ABC transporter substrate-binding protein [Chromohalobacter salexigens]ABE59705.1 Substrate-binding region of ABC-type glycine betaine transport system [Chromohalobacter salexigens DSM 3043]MBZ5874558.1 glycine betaine ABC transporter substrate-binding protein [Chromohalobacter salexigens]MDO0947088.1 glycine betaine ABC transporter substrate-binding protein [Chromohalobacter salexigens]